ncbi:tetratricopeptide repeat protein [Maribacter antarcticus]|uniref:tetratricopeptide repeat protein n=1 Tax=Maribacter antarcticus TaxID=505250 RepID=UPI000685F4AE|nr:tetratricopeptide repeat protein [Maribacter antarcticus]
MAIGIFRNHFNFKVTRTQRSILALVYMLFSATLAAQTVPENFKQLTDSLITTAPSSFTAIHKVMRAHRTDSLYMRFFRQRSKEIGYMAGESYALSELGRTYRNISNYSKAIALHQEALAIAKKADNLEFKISSLNYLGVVYRRTSSVRTAMDFNQQALELAEAVKNPSEGIKRSINVSLNSVGNLYLTLKQYDLAISYFERSIKLEAELNNILGLAINHQNIGKCQEELGALDQALENYSISLSYNQDINNTMGRVICKNSIAKVYIKKEKYQEALRLIKGTMPMAMQLGNSFLIARLYNNLGWAQMKMHQNEDAEQSLLEGYSVGEKHNLRDELAQTSHLLSELYEVKKDYQKALNFKTKAISLDQEILNEGTIRYVNEILFRYDYEKKGNEIAVLAKQNEIVNLKLRKNRTLLLIGALSLILLAGILYILYRQYQLSNEKKILTLEQTMLRSQMNPHFLFNSLNSIKLYIINNEKKNAVHYLNKFSKLVRKILEASSQREIPLAEELETVELYMNIENIRFSNEINFKINISEDIDVHTIKLPSLILQPFLENALWHGLSSKEGEKNITLDVTSGEDGFINIAITDDGVGRDKAEQIKESKVLKRKSIGIDITKERLANFSKDYQNSFHVEIIDIYNDSNLPAGTKILLHIPTI